MSNKKDMSDMTASEISYRKFLKNLGVTTHQEIEKLVNKKIADGELSPKSNLDITLGIGDKCTVKPIIGKKFLILPEKINLIKVEEDHFIKPYNWLLVSLNSLKFNLFL